MITMYDSVDAKTIPLDATVAAGYINGKFRSFDDIVRRVPHARHLSITVNAETDADFIDVEPGDVPPKLVPGWVKRQHAKGVGRPAIYADLTRMKEVLDELNGAGIARSSVRLWCAHYPNNQNVPQADLEHFAHICGPRPGGCGQIGIAMDGTQFTSRSHGRDLDQSLLLDNFFGQRQPPSVLTAQDHASLADLARNSMHSAVSTVLRLTAENSPGGRVHRADGGLPQRCVRRR